MTFTRIGIVGSGIMGSAITEVVLIAGFDVVLRSRSQEAAVSMVNAVERSLARRVGSDEMDQRDAAQAMDRLLVTLDLDELADCDLVIESVVEDLEVKKHLFESLDRICKHSTILATNTSTLPVIEIAASTKRIAQICGIHFFNPANSIGLVEIVRPITASDKTIEIATNFASACSKDPVVVADEAGFVVNALLFPYLNAAVKLLERRVATKEDIDKSMKKGCGYPMGPFALLDLVGLDTSVTILEAMYKESGDPAHLPATTLRRMVAAHKLGRKVKCGFYEYN